MAFAPTRLICSAPTRSKEIRRGGGAADEGLDRRVLMRALGCQSVHRHEIFVRVGKLAVGEAVIVLLLERIHHADIAHWQHQRQNGFVAQHAGGFPARRRIAGKDLGEQPWHRADREQGMR